MVIDALVSLETWPKTIHFGFHTQFAVGNKMHKAFPLPGIEFPLAEEVPTASEEGCHCQKKRDATARKIALLSIKYKTTGELWAAILKTFGGNETTKKTKKNLLKQQYGNFKVKGLENLEQMFNRLQVIIGQLQFMDVEIEQDDLNQKFLTSLAPEWLMHTIVWRNKSDLDTMSLDDLYNHLKAPKALMAIDGVGGDWSYMANDEEDYALVADEVAPTEFALMANTSAESKTGLLEFVNDTVTDYSRPSLTVESTSRDYQNRNPSISENVASPITPKTFIKFVKPKDSQSKSKIDKTEAPKKHPVKKRVKTSFTPKPVAHRPYRPPVRPVKTNMNGARPNRTSFNKQVHSYENRPFHRTSAGRSHYRAPCVPTVNRNFPPVNRKSSTGSRNFPTANRKFPTAYRKFPAGSTKCVGNKMHKAFLLPG
nr:hypothetical protein [Tanacetum cinerariifolium]